MSQVIPQEALVPRVTEEYERLAQRPPTVAEGVVVRHILESRSVWAIGLRAEGLVHLAMSLTEGVKMNVLYVSPDEGLLENRQHRLGRRGSCLTLRDAARRSTAALPVTAWAPPSALNPALLTRAFGTAGPAAIILEDLEAATPASHRYRPSFSQVADAIKQFPNAVLIGSSASGDEALRKSVGRVLGTKLFDKASDKQRGKSAVLVSENTISSNPQLSLRVTHQENFSASELISPLPRPALVICGTPAQADQVFAELEADQIPVHRFHSALSVSERARQLVHFALPGRRAVMVAVSAFGPDSGFAGGKGPAIPDSFGRGYAREDLRSIVHLCAPCSLPQYAAELSLLALAASTDSDESSENVALMVFSPSHLALNLALLTRKRPMAETLETIVQHFLKESGRTWIDERDFDGTVGSPRNLETCLRFLADSGVVERQPGQVRTVASVRELKRTSKSLSEDFDALVSGDAARLAAVEKYALSKECRVQTLSKFLGRPTEEATCGSCDVCSPASRENQEAPVIQARVARRRAPVMRHRLGTAEAEELDEHLG